MGTFDKNELSRLIMASIEGVITPEQSSRLDQLLSEHRDAVEYYGCYLRIYSILVECPEMILESHTIDNDVRSAEIWKALVEYEKAAPAIEVFEPQPQRELIQKVIYPPREKRKLSHFDKYIFAACAAVVLFFVYLYFTPPQYTIEVATLIDQVNVKWSNSAVLFQNGDRLLTHQEPVSLEKGVIKIQYDDGVEVVIEGPAAFEVERSGIYLTYGQLYSRVSNAGLGFRVKTPASVFIDQGTEFGVQADINGSTQLHVIRGKVQLFAGTEGQDKLSQMVTADTAVSYNAAAHKIRSIQLKKHLFVSQIDSKTNAVLRGYTSQYQAAVAETRPAAWYRFEKGQDALGYDEISETVTSCDFSGPVAFADGPAMDSEHENKSMYLSGSDNSGVFLSDKVVMLSGGKALSISLWVRPEAGMEGQQNIICYTDHEKRIHDQMTNHIYLAEDNQIAFYVYNLFKTQISIPFAWTEDVRQNARSDVAKSLEPLPLNQWSHVTACFSDTKMELYVNGRLCETKPIPVRTECHKDGYWAIGRLTKARNPLQDTKRLNYKGYIDEICFYGRMLTAQEIQSLYKAAMPLH